MSHDELWTSQPKDKLAQDSSAHKSLPKTTEQVVPISEDDPYESDLAPIHPPTHPPIHPSIQTNTIFLSPWFQS